MRRSVVQGTAGVGIGLALTLLMLPSPGVSGQRGADVVFRNGAIYTMDSTRLRAQAIAIAGKEIRYVGDDRGVAAQIGPGTKVIDLKGRMLLPGFVDSHIHPTNALLAAGADLQVDNVEQALASVKAWADAHPDAQVIRGFGWRYTLFPSTGPQKAALDRLFPDRPVLLVAIDGHSAWVNNKALDLAGITAKTKDPVPGFSYFARDPKTGDTTGWVVEGPAMLQVLFKLDPPTPEAVLAAMAEQLPKFSAAGLTAVFDAGMPMLPNTDLGFQGYQQLENQCRLPVRVVGNYYWNNPGIADPLPIIRKLRERYQSELVQARVLKINVDGGDLQHTAVMLEPYADRPGTNGSFLLPREMFGAATRTAEAEGIDTHAHSYGDGATRAYLDAVESAQRAYPTSPSRHTAAHALFLSDAEVRRMAQLNVTMQTTGQWLSPDPAVEVESKIVGPKVFFREYGRVGSVLRAGGRVAFGSYWPVAGWVSTFRPLDAIQVAMTRAILPQYGTQQFIAVLPPENERLSLDQALKAYTLNSAYVLGLEDRIGSLKVGKLADLVVLSKDLHSVPPAQVSQTKVQLTMMNGRITYRDGL